MKALPAIVKRHFDIVLWDPRGTGLSTPVPTGCTTNPNTLPVIPATGPIDWGSVTQTFLAAQQAANQQCYEANLDLAPYLGTQFVVRDLDALRQALNVPRWTYWGMSYGTRIGLLYAQLYPAGRPWRRRSPCSAPSWARFAPLGCIRSSTPST
jgi:pimeloyl-ACP methyl ester carboxylesterase